MTKSLRDTFGRMTRRDWLRLGGGAGGVLVLAGGLATLRRWGLVESALAASRTMRDHRVVSTGEQIAIVHGTSAANNVRAALDALGGMRRFVSPQDRVAQILMTEAYRYAEASTVAPFEYTSMILGVAVGYLAFGEVPTIHMIIGGLIVIGAGLFIIWRERRLGIERAGVRKVAPPQ